MRILLAHPNRNDGTSFYRGIGPFSHLQHHYPDIQITDVTLLDFNISWATLIHYDALFYQRPCSLGHLDHIRLAKVCKRPVWIDYDDDVFNVPKHNPRNDLYNGLQEYIAECLRLADFITVTTQAIKDSFIEKLGPEMEKIIVIPNAYDGRIFSNSFEDLAPREKVIFWRGGDTHGNDMAPFIEVIQELVDKYPQYKWAFLGSAPKWITDYRMDPSRLLLYPFQEIFTYFNTLMNLRPEIMVVPMVDEKFSRGRSNISWIEGTLVGAAVVAPKLPEFDVEGTYKYSDVEEFKENIENLIHDETLRESLVKTSLENIPSLSSGMTHRRQSVVAKIYGLISTNKISFREDDKILDNKEILERAITNCQTQETPEHVKGYHELADWLVDVTNAESAVDFGCGTGALLERLLHNNVVAFGLERNEFMIDYFAKRNPVLTEFIKHADFTVSELKFKGFDLAVAIEAFEFIDAPEEWWYEFIRGLSTKFKYFYLVFRPYRSLDDKKMGVVNIRTRAAWQELFCDNGWDVLNVPTRFNGFDIMFKKSEGVKIKIV